MTVLCSECGRQVKPYKGTDLPRVHKRAGGEKCPGGGRFAGTVSPAKAEAARENGAKREREHRYFEIFSEIDDPPDDPLKLCEWAQTVNALALKETIQGRGCKDLNAEIRASSKVIANLVPRTVLSKAATLIKDAAGAGTGKKNKRTGAGRTSRAPASSRPIRG